MNQIQNLKPTIIFDFYCRNKSTILIYIHNCCTLHPSKLGYFFGFKAKFTFLRCTIKVKLWLLSVFFEIALKTKNRRKCKYGRQGSFPWERNPSIMKLLGFRLGRIPRSESDRRPTFSHPWPKTKPHSSIFDTVEAIPVVFDLQIRCEPPKSKCMYTFFKFSTRSGQH